MSADSYLSEELFDKAMTIKFTENALGQRSASYEEMISFISKIFPGSSISARGGKWVLETSVHDTRQVDYTWANTSAHTAYLTLDAQHGNALEAWSYRNAMSGHSLHDIAFAYNKAGGEDIVSMVVDLPLEVKVEEVFAFVPSQVGA